MIVNEKKLDRANSLYRSGQYLLSLNAYNEFVQKYPEIGWIVAANIKLCHKRLKSTETGSGGRNKRPCVSIIIPVHNVEEYLHQCLLSILNQTLENIEIILVDDGSTDKSFDIIEEYARVDKRIISIRNSVASGNSGTPRNQALTRATGEFVSFVDSDDWIEPQMLASLYYSAQASGSDITSSGGFYRENNDGTTEIVKVQNASFDPEVDSREVLFTSHHFPIVWFRIYRREFIERNRIKFGETSTSADLPFAFKSLLLTNKINVVDEVFYHYRFNRVNSTIDRRKGRGAFDLFKSYSLVAEALSTHAQPDRYIPYMVLKAMGDCQYNLRFLADDLTEEFKQEMVSFVALYGRSLCDHPAFNTYWRGVLVSLIKASHELPLSKSIEKKSANSPLLSVIVPAYNVERYIGRCLESLLEQELSSFEIIVIDDGSTDRTSAIVSQYAMENDKIIVIRCNRASGNAGTPRNIGLNKARGEYIGFVDADDWIEKDMYSQLIQTAENSKCDIVSAEGFYRHENGLKKQFNINYIEINTETKNNKEAFSSGFFSNIWNRIYRNDLLKKNHIYFPRIYLAEDFCFSALCHAFASHTRVTRGSYYHYDYSRPNSTTELRKGSKGFAIVDDFQSIVEYFKSFGLYEKFAPEIVRKKMNSLWYTYDRLQDELKPDFLDECRKLAISLKSEFGAQVFSESDLSKLKIIFR